MKGRSLCDGGSAPSCPGRASWGLLIGAGSRWREIETGLPFAHDGRRRLVCWLGARGISVDVFRSRWYVTSVGKCYTGADAGILRVIHAVTVGGAPLVALPRGQVRCCAASDRAGRLPRPPARVRRRRPLDDLVGRSCRESPGRIGDRTSHPSGASTWLNDSGGCRALGRGIEAAGARCIRSAGRRNRETRMGWRWSRPGRLRLVMLVVGSLGAPRPISRNPGEILARRDTPVPARELRSCGSWAGTPSSPRTARRRRGLDASVRLAAATAPARLQARSRATTDQAALVRDACDGRPRTGGPFPRGRGRRSQPALPAADLHRPLPRPAAAGASDRVRPAQHLRREHVRRLLR